MTLQEFIDKHRGELTKYIETWPGICVECDIDDDERELWIANDESLYNWAKNEGVEDL